jgi:hypothetical protein
VKLRNQRVRGRSEPRRGLRATPDGPSPKPQTMSFRTDRAMSKGLLLAGTESDDTGQVRLRQCGSTGGDLQGTGSAGAEQSVRGEPQVLGGDQGGRARARGARAVRRWRAPSMRRPGCRASPSGRGLTSHAALEGAARRCSAPFQRARSERHSLALALTAPRPTFRCHWRYAPRPLVGANVDVRTPGSATAARP